MRNKISIIALALAAFSPICAMAQNAPTMLDNFDIQNTWKADASDGVSAIQTSVAGKNGNALRMDYDFHNRSGYAFITRILPITFPQDYEVSFYIRGSGPKNNLEFKVKDKSGDNVWWNFTRDFQPTNEWQLVKFKKRQFTFAWGPIADKTLKQTESMDFVISAGAGGKGFIEIDDLKITPLAIDNSPPPAPIILKDNAQTLVDLGRVREFGALKLVWDKAPSNYSVFAIDEDGNEKNLANVNLANQDMQIIKATESDARKIKIISQNGAQSLKNIEILPLEYASGFNEFIQNNAKSAPLGTYSRNMSGQEEFWTLIGTDGGHDSALISEDGAIEIARLGFRIEPFIFENGKRFDWSNVKIEHELKDKYLPIPSAIWKEKKWKLKTTTYVFGNSETSQTYGEYQITNTTNKSLILDLMLNLRPYQVNGPLQFLSTNGGYTPINEIAFDGDKIKVNDRIVKLNQVPNKSIAANYWQGEIAQNQNITTQSAKDEYGLANGAVVYKVSLKPNETKTFSFLSPLSGQMTQNLDIIAEKAKTEKFWREKLNQVQIEANGKGQEIANAIKTNLAYILMMRDGPMLRPGSRSYARSWIRDGAMISEGLLRLGLFQEAKDYLAWYTPFQFDNGKIPCCADFRGSDPVPENDSHGEYIYLVSQIYKYTHDKAILEKYWPNVKSAFEYINSQRLLERAEKNESPERRQLYGLMPPTISHEGYSDKIAYSNWDNFWTLRGMIDAVEIAMALEKPENDQMNLDRYEFETDLKNAIEIAQKKYNLKYIPGAQDRGDFDATSTTIALLLNLEDRFPKEWFNKTFDKYWDNFVKRRDIDKGWKDYTPYEWRVVSAFTRLGQADRANAASQFFLNDRLPKEWNAFAEVVGREKRTPRYLGDLPHGWVASDFIRSSIDRFFYEKTGFEVILGGGIDKNWLAGNGISINGLLTTQGKISFNMRYIKGILNVSVKGADEFNYSVPAQLITKNTLIFNGKKIKTNGGDFIQYPPVEMK